MPNQCLVHSRCSTNVPPLPGQSTSFIHPLARNQLLPSSPWSAPFPICRLLISNYRVWPSIWGPLLHRLIFRLPGERPYVGVFEFWAQSSESSFLLLLEEIPLSQKYRKVEYCLCRTSNSRQDEVLPRTLSLE